MFRSLSFRGSVSLVLFLFLLSAAAVAQPCDDFQWTNPQPQGNRLAGIAYGRGRFVAVGRAGTIVSSVDGVQWGPEESSTRADLWDVVWTGASFTAVGDKGTVLTSPDGLLWSGSRSGTDASLRKLLWTGSQFIAVGDRGTVITEHGCRVLDAARDAGGQDASRRGLQRIPVRGRGGLRREHHERGRGRMVLRVLRRDRLALRGRMGRIAVRRLRDRLPLVWRSR